MSERVDWSMKTYTIYLRARYHFSHLLKTCFSASYVPGTVLDVGDPPENKNMHSPCFHDIKNLVKTDINQTPF